MRKRIQKTININGIRTTVEVEIDEAEDKLVQAAINTDNLRRQGFSGINKHKGNAAASRLRELKNSL